MHNKVALIIAILSSLITTQAWSTEDTYSTKSVGIGVDNYGVNVKVQTDKQSETNRTKNIIEVKGFTGDSLGWAGTSERDNSIDSVRIRHFNSDLKSAFGTYIDGNYEAETQTLDASMSATWLYSNQRVEIMPYVGAGVTTINGDITVPENDEGLKADDYYAIGYTLPGVYGQVGMYAKIKIIENISLLYNPEWRSTLGGQQGYVDSYYEGGKSTIFNNDIRLVYQINYALDVQYRSEWNAEEGYSGATRGIEVNYHF